MFAAKAVGLALVVGFCGLTQERSTNEVRLEAPVRVSESEGAKRFVAIVDGAALPLRLSDGERARIEPYADGEQILELRGALHGAPAPESGGAAAIELDVRVAIVEEYEPPEVRIAANGGIRFAGQPVEDLERDLPMLLKSVAAAAGGSGAPPAVTLSVHPAFRYETVHAVMESLAAAGCPIARTTLAER